MKNKYCSQKCYHISRIKEKNKMKCQYCGKKIIIDNYDKKQGRGKYCSRECYRLKRKANRIIDCFGYVRIGGIREHKLIWEKHFRKLREGMVIHHLNGIKTDNRIENLCALKRYEHSPLKIVEPFRKRIKLLENIIKNLKNQKSFFKD